MFNEKQKIIQKQLPKVIELCAQHGIDLSRLEELAPQVANFKIRVPFIGAFSSGKSSLLNALIREPLLSTDITPETAVATELGYSEARCFVGHLLDGSTFNLQEADVTENKLNRLLPDGWLSIELPCPVLGKTPHLVLVDMPGWGSGIDAQQRVAGEYARRSLAYAVVVSAEEGTLRDSVRQALMELGIQEKPVILVIAKAHKRQEHEVAGVAQRIVNEITQLMGAAPLAVAITSAAKRDAAQLERALQLLESKAELVFESSVVAAWRSELERVLQIMKLLSNQDFKDAEIISAEIEIFERKMDEFGERLIRETEGLEEHIGPIITTIGLRINSTLTARLDSITDRAMSGSGIGDEVLGVARLVVAQTLKEEFEPALRRYVSRLVDALPSRLDLNIDFSNIQSTVKIDEVEFKWKGLATLLTPLLAGIPHPLAKIAAIVLPILTSLLGSKADNQRQEVQEARQRERAKGQVRQAITEAANGVVALLQPALSEQVLNAKALIAKNIALERSDIERALSEKRQSLKDGEEQAAALRTKAQLGQKLLENCLGQIGAATTHAQCSKIST